MELRRNLSQIRAMRGSMICGEGRPVCRGQDGVGFLQELQSLLEAQVWGDRDESATGLACFAGNGLEEDGSTGHVHFQASGFPVGGTGESPFEPKPAPFIDASQNSVAEVEVFFEMTVEASQVLEPGIKPQIAAHGVKDAGFDGVRGIVGIGAEAEVATAVFFAGVGIEKGIRQQVQDAADSLFVVEVLFAMAGLLGWGA